MRQGFPTLAFSWQNWIGVYDICRKSWNITFWSLASKVKIKDIQYCTSRTNHRMPLYQNAVLGNRLTLYATTMIMLLCMPHSLCCWLGFFLLRHSHHQYCDCCCCFDFFPFNFAWEIRAAKCVTLNFLMAFYCLSIGEFTSSNFG